MLKRTTLIFAIGAASAFSPPTCLSNAPKPFLFTDHLSQSRPLSIRYESWPTARLAAQVAGIILKERLGFEVDLTPTAWGTDPTGNDTTANAYVGVGSAESASRGFTGDMLPGTNVNDLAVEVWPVGKESSWAAHGNLTTKTEFPELSARVGIYETCHRHSWATAGRCTEVTLAGGATPFTPTLTLT